MNVIVVTENNSTVTVEDLTKLSTISVNEVVEYDVVTEGIQGPPGPTEFGGFGTDINDPKAGEYIGFTGQKWVNKAPVAIERYEFIDTLEWLVNHNKGSTKFFETLTDSDGNRFYAKVQIIDINTFVVKLSSATSGYIDVMFTDVPI